MLEFQKLCPGDRERFLQYFKNIPEKGCEYAMVNLLAWGRQRVHFGEEFLTIFSQFDRASVYPFPVGSGDIKAALDAIFAEYAGSDSWNLSRLSHGEICWKISRKGVAPNESSKVTIPVSDIRLDAARMQERRKMLDKMGLL